jgi:hypothetical protein
MDNAITGFYRSFNNNKLACHEGLSVAFLHGWPDNDIHISGLIFQCQKHHSRGSARTLSTGDESGDTDKAMIAQANELFLRCALAKRVLGAQ